MSQSHLPCLPMRPFTCMRRPSWLAAIVLAVMPLLASAQTPAGKPDAAAAIAQESQAWLDQAVAAARPPGAAPLRMVGAGWRARQPADAGAMRPGRALSSAWYPAVGQDACRSALHRWASRWNVFLPVQVQAFGQTWVMRSDVASGTVLVHGRCGAGRGRLGPGIHSVLADPEMWVGQTATRQLRTGQTLRHGMVKPSQVFQAGSMVRIVAQGPVSA
jgi:flagella basal body P-ring formation protein FlgA